MVAAKPRRRLPVAERRALIVEGAGRLFGEGGYDGVRLDEIAAAAGVTKPILYRHFESKERLYLALLERHSDDLSGFAAAIPPQGPLETRLRTVLEIWVAYVEDHPYAWRMIFRDSGGGREIQEYRKGLNARAQAVLAGLIGALTTERSIPRREIEPLAALMSMGMASLVLWWLDSPHVPREAIIDALTRVWTGLLNG